MFIIVLTILIIFILALAAIWIWYVKNDVGQEPDLYDLAFKAFKKKDFKQAEGFLSKFLSAQPNAIEARMLLVQTYRELKNYEGAKECIEKVLKVAPKNVEMLSAMAQVLECQQSFEEAKDYYKRALQEDPTKKAVHNSMGSVNFKQGNYQEAIEMFQKTLEGNPGNVEASYGLVKCKTELCDYSKPEEVQSLIDEYLKIAQEPGLPKEFDVTLALVYAKTGQVDKTLAASQRALECDSESVQAYKILGLTQLVKHDFAAAKNTLTTGLNLDPSNEEMHNILSYALCQQKNRCVAKECRDKYKETVSQYINKDRLNVV